jgi:hypothetical protein
VTSSMRPCPGLHADWLNGWLAAIGITVLLDDARLAWTDSRRPVAVLDYARGSEDLVAALCRHLPTLAALETLAIANPEKRFPRTITPALYLSVADGLTPDDFSLTSSVTDLATDLEGSGLAHSRLDPPAPHGETLWNRLTACRREVDGLSPLAVAITASLDGAGARVETNGLGFDFQRLTAAAKLSGSGNRVDPVIECLAFFGLALFPVRGNGRRASTRGFVSNALRWPVWRQPLDRWGIDALLGALYARPEDVARHRLLGIHAAFESVRFEKTPGTSDVTAAFASRRLR